MRPVAEMNSRRAGTGLLHATQSMHMPIALQRDAAWDKRTTRQVKLRTGGVTVLPYSTTRASVQHANRGSEPSNPHIPQLYRSRTVYSLYRQFSQVTRGTFVPTKPSEAPRTGHVLSVPRDAYGPRKPVGAQQSGRRRPHPQPGLPAIPTCHSAGKRSAPCWSTPHTPRTKPSLPPSRSRRHPRRHPQMYSCCSSA